MVANDTSIHNLDGDGKQRNPKGQQHFTSHCFALINHGSPPRASGQGWLGSDFAWKPCPLKQPATHQQITMGTEAQCRYHGQANTKWTVGKAHTEYYAALAWQSNRPSAKSLSQFKTILHGHHALDALVGSQ